MTDQFLGKENTDVLWEVLCDDETVPKTQDTQKTFVLLLPRFHAKYKDTTHTLMDMNKQFISDIMKEFDKQSPSKSIDSKNMLITSDDLRKERSQEFENELKKKENDFHNSMSRPVPEEPNFKDNFEDKPLGNVNDEIEKMIRERNLEISSIQRTHNVKEAEKWLSSTNSSITTLNQQEKADGLKTIKIEKDELGIKVPTESLDESLRENKHVTWNENITIEMSEIQDSVKPTTSDKSSIFTKLKPASSHTTSQLQSKPEIVTMLSENPVLKNNQSLDNVVSISELYEYVKKRFDRLETMIEDNMCISNSNSQSDQLAFIMEKESDNSDLGSVEEDT